MERLPSFFQPALHPLDGALDAFFREIADVVKS
jgi:hypothetical protein